ncbi:MAG: hypothetical protein MZV63_47535 [Marinilabiliales bacterium]|nr:hypothetical protein [Marinilabiliales bacterium]
MVLPLPLVKHAHLRHDAAGGTPARSITDRIVAGTDSLASNDRLEHAHRAETAS